MDTEASRICPSIRGGNPSPCPPPRIARSPSARPRRAFRTSSSPFLLSRICAIPMAAAWKITKTTIITTIIIIISATGAEQRLSRPSVPCRPSGGTYPHRRAVDGWIRFFLFSFPPKAIPSSPDTPKKSFAYTMEPFPSIFPSIDQSLSLSLARSLPHDAQVPLSTVSGLVFCMHATSTICLVHNARAIDPSIHKKRSSHVTRCGTSLKANSEHRIHLRTNERTNETITYYTIFLTS